MTEYSVDDRVLVPGVVQKVAYGAVVKLANDETLIFRPGDLRPDPEGSDTGRPITADDVRDAHHAAWGVPNGELFRQSVAEYLNHIAQGGERASAVSEPLPIMPPEVREALAHYREHEYSLDLLDRPQRFPRAATLVRWLLSVTGDSAERASADPERDDDMYGTTCLACLDPLDDDHPYGTNADGDHVHYACADDVPTDPSPRTWSLPAPPPDDVTVEYRVADGPQPDSAHPDERPVTCTTRHRDQVETWFEHWRTRWSDARIETRTGKDSPWVVEGEPPAPEPEYAVGNWVRVPTTDGDTVTVGAPALDRRPHPDSRWDTRTETWEPAPEPPRFERGFYRLARDLDTEQGMVTERLVFIALQDAEDGTWRVFLTTGDAWTSSAALAAAGAEWMEDGS